MAAFVAGGSGTSPTPALSSVFAFLNQLQCLICPQGPQPTALHFPTQRHFCSVAFLPPKPTVEVAPHSGSRVFKDRSSSHSGPYAHGHHPVGPVESTPCWLGEDTKSRSPPPGFLQARQSWVTKAFMGTEDAYLWVFNFLAAHLGTHILAGVSSRPGSPSQLALKENGATPLRP